MMTLVVKELRQLLPIAWLWLAVLVFSYATRFLTERIDEETFGGWCEGYCEAGSHPWVASIAILFSIVTAYSLFPREHDESTIDFLRALPLSRWRIHAGKLLAGWMLLVGINVLSYAIDALLLASNPESLGGRFVSQVWWTLLWRDCVFAFVILAHGVVLSWFRTTGLIVYALYVLLIIWFENRTGSAGLFSVFGMLSNEYDAQRLVVDTRAIIVHVVAAVGFLLLGYRLWSRTESAATGGKVTQGSSTWQRALRAGFLFMAFTSLALVALYRTGAGNGTLVDETLGQATTEHYRFVYRVQDEETVEYLLKHAEQDLADVAGILGVQALPLVRVDLSAASEHAAGLAKWKKIRMDLSSFEADLSQRRVLAHEATHVLQAIESNRALARQFATAQFFIEGMAQYVSFEVVPEPLRRVSNHALAAVAHARQDIRFDDLIDSAGFADRFDPELYYSLGDLWSIALVDTCGESVLGDFLRAAGRDDASTDIGGERFWRDTFRETGCDLDAVNAHWSDRMATTLASVDQSRFPYFEDITVARDSDTGRVNIEATLVSAPDAATTARDAVDGEYGSIVEPVRLVARIRSAGRLSAGVDPTFRGTLERDGARLVARFSIPDHIVPRNRFGYQLGYTPDVSSDILSDNSLVREGASDSRVFYERWREGSVLN